MKKLTKKQAETLRNTQEVLALMRRLNVKLCDVDALISGKLEGAQSK